MSGRDDAGTLAIEDHAPDVADAVEEAPADWDPRGGEVFGQSLLVELDELEPVRSRTEDPSADETREARDPMVDPVERAVTKLLVEGHLGIPRAGTTEPVRGDDHREALQALGREVLRRSGIDLDEFRASYFAAKEERSRGGS